jgi:glucose/arabinose dehydrogenase
MIRNPKTSGQFRPLLPIILSVMSAAIFITVIAFVQIGAAASSSAITSQVEGEIEISLVHFTTVPFDPVDLASSGLEDDLRLFVVQQNGVIQVSQPDGTLETSPFLDIQDRVAAGGEMGLLGLVFDPDYQTNNFFYVNYTHMEGFSRFSRISRFEVTSDADVADPSSELILITIPQPQSNHNGGDLNFGGDGYLYIAMGDGGGAGDPNDLSQDLQEYLGKMLRIDVTGTTSTTNYLIPPDNPFVGDSGALDEIWSLGLRNPWRFSFDKLTDDLYIADVGQYLWEEVNRQPASSAGGENWGWRCYEGDEEFNTAGCGISDAYDFPIHVYHHSQGCAVTGGYVYRGTLSPVLYGKYLFADYCLGTIWALENDGDPVLYEIGSIAGNWTTFGEDINGELYIANKDNNVVYRIVIPIDNYFPLLNHG